MKRALLSMLLAACASAPMPLERVFARPEGPLPRGAAFHPDGKRIVYLRARGADGLSDLWEYRIATGEHRVLFRAPGRQKLSAEERAARERRRDRSIGIGRFLLNPVDGTILVPLSGDLHLLKDGALSRLTETRAPERNPRWSPDGTAVAYVRDDNLYVLREGEETRLTRAGAGKVRCGLPEFIAMEELGRHEGFWWSKDSRRIAYACTDSTAVPVFFMHDYLDPRGRPVEQEYPRAGDENVRWELKVVSAAGGEPVAMQVAGEYLVRVDWMPDGALAVQLADRSQRKLTLYRCDPDSGEARVLLEETDDAWVAFHRDLRFLKDGRFLWSSERTGRRHLYLWANGEPRALTSGDWDVARVLGVDEEREIVDFEGSRESARERHLYRVDLSGDGLRRLTDEPGWHRVQRSKDGRWFLDTYSRAGVPPRILLRGGDGRPRAAFAESRSVPGLPRPEFVTIPASDGTPLQAMLYRARGAGPAIVFCYGGPGSHLVADRWGGGTYLWHVRMTQLGYHVLTVDNRGAGGYGREFRRVVSGRLCDFEVRDQAAAARWLKSRPFVAPDRVGIWGWSYGGTLTLMCLLHAPDAFSAGVAVAPVTDWRDYDTAYTERYLGLPAENPEGYALSSPITAAATLKRPLYLAHGFMDDNVHFRGAVAFLDRAQRAGRAVEADFYPRGAHGIGGKGERTLLFSRMEAFWRTHIGR